MAYKDDATILGWDLLNEPRCESWLVEGCDDMLQAWLDDVAPFVKSLAPKQLVLIGSEGFYDEQSSQVRCPCPQEFLIWPMTFCSGSSQPAVAMLQAESNPQSWATQMGQNYTRNTATPGIDLAGMHVWCAPHCSCSVLVGAPAQPAIQRSSTNAPLSQSTPDDWVSLHQPLSTPCKPTT